MHEHETRPTQQAFYVGSSDDFEQEVVTARKNKRLMKFLDERGAARETGRGIPFAEVRRRLGSSPRSE